MRNLSTLTDRLTGQPMFRLLADAMQMERNGRDVLHFEIGDLIGFNSPKEAVDAVKLALDQGETNYTNSCGLLEYREAVVDYSRKVHGVDVGIDQVLATPANAVVDWVVRCIAEPGDEALIPDPGFPTYRAVINYTGMVPVPINMNSEHGFEGCAQQIRSKITPRSRLIIVNSPHNPTGSCMNENDANRVAKLAKEHNLFLLSDEVYAPLHYRSEHFSPGALDQCREQTIILGSLSKSHAMAGWRLGYVIAPSVLVEKMGLLLQTILSCLPAFTQRGGIEAMKVTEGFSSSMRRNLEQRRNLLIEGLNRLPGVKCVMPQGAFYAFPQVQIGNLSDVEYASELLRTEGVCVVPGRYFGDFGKGHVRMAFGSADRNTIREALTRMARFHISRS